MSWSWLGLSLVLVIQSRDRRPPTASDRLMPDDKPTLQFLSLPWVQIRFCALSDSTTRTHATYSTFLPAISMVL